MSGEKILPRDNEIKFPEFIILKASAGTGKTHNLTLRFTQFLLSEKIAHNDPREILAITFTRNAAKEMKNRIFEWLKHCYFQKKEKIADLLELLSLSDEELKPRAEAVLEKILTDYADFQVSTIDSFMTEVFKASAIDLGLSPDFEISLDSRPVIAYSFFKLMRKVRPDSSEGQLMIDIASDLKRLREDQARFFWDPTEEIREKFTELYHRLEFSNRQPLIKTPEEKDKELKKAESDFRKALRDLKKAVTDSGLELNQNSSYYKRQHLEAASRWLDCSFGNLPVKKPKKDNNRGYLKVTRKWQELEEKLNNYREVYARNYFQPYLQIYQQLSELVEKTKRERALVLLEDVHRRLASFLEEEVVPDVYFSLGTRIYHYLIDEFQDTSPLQWKNLEPLILNALSQGGSLFIVGDTKQAIYGFREADYRIMVDLEKGKISFPPVQATVKSLKINRRSQEEILDFVRKIFPEGIKNLNDEKNQALKEAARQSGLDDYETVPLKNPHRQESELGYVEVEIIEPDNFLSTEQQNSEEPATGEEPEATDQETRVKERIQNLVLELRERGYHYADIGLLTYRNETVAEIAAWLNEKNIPFVPFSALDIRKRPVVREILSFLQFLDFPLDDLNLAVFITGQIFERRLKAESSNLTRELIHLFLQKRTFLSGQRLPPLYLDFKENYPRLWEIYFEQFFRTVGFLPLYELVSQIFQTFKLFELFPEEQAALIKLLEVIKAFEGQGQNNLRDFLSYSEQPEDDQGIWTVDVPLEHEAVKIMTIHKAKGLGFPVVILILKNQPFIPPLFYLEEKSNNLVEILKLDKKLIEASLELKKVYDDFRVGDDVNRLNSLYVALTRAREELYVIGIRGRNVDFPFNLLKSFNLFNYRSAKKKPWRQPKVPRPPAPTLEIRTIKSLIPETAEVDFKPKEKKLGLLLHSLLAEIEFLEEEAEKLLLRLTKKSTYQIYPREELDKAIEILIRCFHNPELVSFFKRSSDRLVFRELELVASNGYLYRLDRLIVDREDTKVLDFKTARPENPALHLTYVNQIKNYAEILRDIFPDRPVSCWLLYLENSELEKVL